MDRTKRLSDQILILQSIEIVREELLTCGTDPRDMHEVMERLGNLYACIDTTKIITLLKQADIRGDYGK